MELTDILAISGYPGLYKFVARSSRGVIVESLTDGRRMNAPTHSKVSAMSDIAIFTDEKDLPLAEVFQAIRQLTDGKQAIDRKAPESEVEEFFARVVPSYDRSRVHLSDMRKVIAWYNILVGCGMEDFVQPEEPDRTLDVE